MSKPSSSIEAKREEFRKYLEKEGILESLTKSLVALYETPDKPVDALSFLRNNFVGQSIEDLEETIEKLSKDNQELLDRVSSLVRENDDLKNKVAAFEAQDQATKVSAKQEEASSRPKKATEDRSEEEEMDTKDAEEGSKVEDAAGNSVADEAHLAPSD